MGGDQGPLITLPAAIKAVENFPHLHLVLCGDENIIVNTLKQNNFYPHERLSIIATTQVVEMNDKPIFALRNKKQSSMRKALDLVHDEKAQACVSAGNTGALFSMAHFVLKTLPGVERPALISALPTNNPKQHVFMLDLGANVFCDSSVLYQFAIMGSVMAKEVDGIENPKVALLNMGEEDNKGSDHIKQTASYLLANDDINYIGFIEGNDIFTNKADVIVCDGFVGNVALKTCEGVARMVYKQLQHILSQHFLAQIMGKLLSSTLKKLFKPMNPDQYNGASLIGLRGIVVKSHGNANITAFYTAIVEAITEVERQVPAKIKDKLEHGLSHKE
jgi:glycerol-3-phosphate acyltransferase PlsX